MNCITITYYKKNDDGADEKVGISVDFDDINDYTVGSIIDFLRDIDPTEANNLCISKTTDEAVILSNYKRDNCYKIQDIKE